MCLAAIAIGQSARFPWVLASNRDEYFDRKAEPLAWWTPPGGDVAVLGGRDISAGGTWLALTASGRLALVTNVREPGRQLTVSPSRGDLVPQWLQGRLHGLHGLMQVPRNGFNLFAAELASSPARSAITGPDPEPAGHADAIKGAAQWFSNRPQPVQRQVGAGVFGLSNAAWDTAWPKVETLKRRLSQALNAAPGEPALLDAAFGALADPLPAADDQLPATGLPLERERQLSSAFIHIPLQPVSSGAPGAPSGGPGSAGVYGTRCSTVVLVEQQARKRHVLVVERSFDAGGGVSMQHEARFTLPTR